MDTCYTIEPLDHKHSSVNEGEVLLSTAHSCGHKFQYLMRSAEHANKMIETYQNTECRECASNTASIKRTGGYLAK